MSSLPWIPMDWGNYISDTAMLNLTEHGAYTLLMAYCYTSEQSIPLKEEDQYRVCRAFSDEERAAVLKVISLFFFKKKDGFHQKRIDLEIRKRKATSRKRKEAGKLGGLKKVANAKASATILLEQKATHKDLDLEVDLDLDIKKDLDSKEPLKPIVVLTPQDQIYKSIIDDLNQRVSGSFKPGTKSTRGFINARMAEGHTEDEFYIVNEYKTHDWLGSESAKYLRPSTLYNSEKFEGYLAAGTRWVEADRPMFERKERLGQGNTLTDMTARALVAGQQKDERVRPASFNPRQIAHDAMMERAGRK